MTGPVPDPEKPAAPGLRNGPSWQRAVRIAGIGVAAVLGLLVVAYVWALNCPFGRKIFQFVADIPGSGNSCCCNLPDKG